MSEISAKTYDNILTKGLQSQLSTTPIEDGKLRFTTDTGKLFMDCDYGNGLVKRVRISDIDDSLTEEEIFAQLAPLPKIYISKDTHRAYVNSALEWYDLSAILLTESAVEDVDKPVWFSPEADNEPQYSTDVTYNTDKKELKASNIIGKDSVIVGAMKITDVINDDGITHTVEFSFV